MPLWEKLEALGICVSLCIASQDYNQFSDVVTSFPHLRIVLEDLGSGPGTILSQYVPILLEYARYPQVYVSISRLFRVSSLPHPYRDLWPVLEEISQGVRVPRVWSGDPAIRKCCRWRAVIEVLPACWPLKPDEMAGIVARAGITAAARSAASPDREPARA